MALQWPAGGNVEHVRATFSGVQLQSAVSFWQAAQSLAAAIAPGLKACVRGFGSVLRGLWRGLCRAVTFPFKCVAEICIEIYLACTKVAGVSKASRDAARAVVRTGGVGDGDRAEDPPADPRLMV